MRFVQNANPTVVASNERNQFMRCVCVSAPTTDLNWVLIEQKGKTIYTATATDGLIRNSIDSG